MFSIKQTAVPAGLLLAGFLGPAMAAAWGWRGAMLATGAACLAGGGDACSRCAPGSTTTGSPSRRFRLSDFRATIASVVTTPDLRNLSFACFAFNGIQSVFTAYFVTYLVALGYDLAAAGSLFSIVVALAVPCRVLWGWLGSFHVAPRLVMAGLALGMAVGVAATGAFGAGMADRGGRAGRRRRQRHRGLLARHPVVRDRAARAGRPGRRGDRRGPVVRADRRARADRSCSRCCSILTGGYGAGWAVCAIPALWVGVTLLRSRPAPASYQAVQPPSTSNDEPVTRPAAGEARNTTA